MYAFLDTKKKSYHKIAQIHQNFRTFTNIIENVDVEDGMSVRDVYDCTGAIKRSITRLKTYEKQLRHIYQKWGIFPQDLGKIRASLEDGRQKVKQLEEVLTTDEVAKTTTTEYTGNAGSLWYDTPLREFLETYLHKEAFIQGYGFDRVDDMKKLLLLCQRNFPEADSIGTDSGTIPKNLLIDFIQQLIVIEKIFNYNWDTISEKRRYSKKIDKIIYKLHTNFQISPTHLEQMLGAFFGQEFRNSEIMKRSARNFLKFENIPPWVKSAWESYVENDDSLGADMKF